MLSDAIRRWNPWWAEGKLSIKIVGVKREKLEEVERSIDTVLIKGIIGPRRAGKTTLLYQTINYLIQQGVSHKNIVLLNFDDNNIYNADFDILLSECRKINPKITHLFLDEVQERKNWERWVRTLYDTHQFLQIFVTGSSSSLLKEDVARVLTGRHTTFHMLPFSFKEYLVYSDWKDFSKDYMEHKKDEILHHLNRYLKTGGYPEALGIDDMARNRYLNELFDDIIARDITARHKADYHLARRIAYYTISNASNIMTHRSIANACGVAVDTVSKYLRYMHESCLIQPLQIFSFKLKEQMREINKYYTVDTGLANAVSFRFSENLGQMVENTVYIELLRRCKSIPGIEIYYWKDKTGKEVDFLVKKGEKVERLIQVCYDLSEEKTKKREVSGLIRAMDEFTIHEGTIITDNYEDTETIEGKTIVYTPLWKWLLGK
jgi:hypothetical protein